MPTLLQINTVINLGSTGRIAEEAGQLAIEYGWKSYIAYGRNYKNSHSKSKLIRIGSNLDLNLHALQTRIFDQHGLGSYEATKKFIRQIKEIKPDIIHLQNLHGYYLNINVLFEYLSKVDIPIIWTFYDCWPMTGHCTYFDSVNCQKWETACSNCPQKKSYPASFLIDRSRKNYILKKELFTSIKRMIIMSNSQWLGNIIKQSFFKNYPVKIINSGVDLQHFSPQSEETKALIRKKYKLANKFVCIGVSINWPQRKGLNDFIKLSKELSDDSIIFLVGLSKSQLQNLPSNLIGITRTEKTQELAELYSAADVFVNPTWEDNFPSTNLEALACGIPIITYKTGGSIESVCPETGFIVEKGDIHGLVTAIETIRKNGKKYYSKDCREYALKMYDKNDRYLDYVNLYNTLLNNE